MGKARTDHGQSSKQKKREPPTQGALLLFRHYSPTENWQLIQQFLNACSRGIGSHVNSQGLLRGWLMGGFKLIEGGMREVV